MFAAYEKEVKETLGGDDYEDCLWLCDNGKINTSQICEFAHLLDTRIPAILSNQSSSVQRNARKSFRCVMSEWYNFSAQSEGTFSPFIKIYNSKENECQYRKETTDTPIKRKDINVINTRAQYITKKDIVVFSKITKRLGVEN